MRASSTVESDPRACCAPTYSGGAQIHARCRIHSRNIQRDMLQPRLLCLMLMHAPRHALTRCSGRTRADPSMQALLRYLRNDIGLVSADSLLLRGRRRCVRAPKLGERTRGGSPSAVAVVIAIAIVMAIAGSLWAVGSRAHGWQPGTPNRLRRRHPRPLSQSRLRTDKRTEGARSARRDGETERDEGAHDDGEAKGSCVLAHRRAHTSTNTTSVRQSDTECITETDETAETAVDVERDRDNERHRERAKRQLEEGDGKNTSPDRCNGRHCSWSGAACPEIPKATKTETGTETEAERERQ